MTDIIKPARTETFEHTISGLLTKRQELCHDAEAMHTQLAILRNDIAAIDRVLGTLGYAEEFIKANPRRKREAIIGAGEGTRRVFDILREAAAPLSSRQIAKMVIESCGQDAGDRNLLSDRTNRISRMMRRLRDRQLVEGVMQPEGVIFWSLDRERQP